MLLINADVDSPCRYYWGIGMRLSDMDQVSRKDRVGICRPKLKDADVVSPYGCCQPLQMLSALTDVVGQCGFC